MRQSIIIQIITDVLPRVHSRQFREQILRVKDRDYFPMIIVANKRDLEHQRRVQEHEGMELARQYGCQFISTSAKARHQVDEAFYQLVREIRRYNREQQAGRPGGMGASNGAGGMQQFHHEKDGHSGGCCSGCVAM
ncbi:RAS1 protein [Cystobasidiomycetes sp. EMM_F5]